MPKTHPFITFLLKKANLEDPADLGLSREIHALNQEIRLKNPRIVTNFSEKDFSEAYKRVRERESTFRKVVNRQLTAGEDILDSTVSMWLDEFREKKQQFLKLKANQVKNKNKLYKKVLEQENKTHEMIHNLFMTMEEKEQELEKLAERKLYYTPFSVKLATSLAVAFVLAISLVRVTPNISQAIIEATDSITIKPLLKTVAWLGGPSYEKVEISHFKFEMSPALNKDELSAYILANSNYISAEARGSDSIYINKNELAYSQKQIEQEVEVLAETYDYDSFMNKFKRGVKDLILEMADKQRNAVDVIEKKLEDSLR